MAVSVLGPIAHSGLPLEVIFGVGGVTDCSSMVRANARETVDSFVQVRAALRCVTPYVLA